MKKMLFGLLLVIFAAGCSSKPEMDNRVVARVGDINVTVFDMDYNLIRFNYKDPDDEWFKKEDFIKQHVDKLLIADAGVKIGLRDSVEVDSSQIVRILYELVYKKEITDKLNINEKDVRRFWEKYGGEIHLAQIVVSSKSLADSLSKVLQSEPGKFNEFVTQFSEEAITRERGGDLGWLRVTDTPDELRETAFSLKPGQISSAVKSPFGWHVLMLLDKRKHSDEDYETEKGNYRVTYSIYKRDELQQALVKSLEKRFHYEVFEDSIRVLADKALKAREAAGGSNQALSSFIKAEDLTPEESKMVIARADNYQYTGSEFIREMNRFLGRDGVNFDNIEVARKTLSYLLAYRLMYLYGKESGLENTPEFKRRYEETVLGLIYNKMQRDYILDTVTVTDEDLKEGYKTRLFKYEVPEQIKVAEILSETEAEADEISRQLKNGVPFSRLVEKTVRPGFAATGGNLGYCSTKRFPVVYEAVKGKKKGSYSEPTAYEGKWAVFMVTGYKPAYTKPLSEVESSLKTEILANKKYTVNQNWLDMQKKKVECFIDFDFIKNNLETGKLKDES
jgi:peptidyl-prolyl cis-trans isomerase C